MRSLFCRSSDDSKSQLCPRSLTTWPSDSLCLRWRFHCCIILFSDLNDCADISVSFCGLHYWSQFKCCCLQYDVERRESLETGISKNYVEFREMQIVRNVKYVGILIARDGRIHRWRFSRRKKIIPHVLKIIASAQFYLIHIRVGQDNPQERKKCPSLYTRRLLSRYIVSSSWSWLHTWSWSWLCEYSLHHSYDSLASCRMFGHVYPRSWKNSSNFWHNCTSTFAFSFVWGERISCIFHYLDVFVYNHHQLLSIVENLRTLVITRRNKFALWRSSLLLTST